MLDPAAKVNGFVVLTMIVQIYEIQTPGEAESLIELGVDHIGSVILSNSSWKDPILRETVQFTRSAGSRSSLIPLFSNLDSILQTVDYYQPDIIHFCETLSNHAGILDNCKNLRDIQTNVKAEFPEIRIMRSIPIAPPGSAHIVPTLDLAAIFEPVTDIFLTDTLLVPDPDKPDASNPQPVSGYIGITGQICDWQMARRLVAFCGIPVILAGGISPDNVAGGVAHVRPAGVDSCTATNVVDGRGRSIRFKKDPEKVRRLIEGVRRAEGNSLLSGNQISHT